MEKLLTSLAVVGVAAAILFLLVIAATVVGALVGWVVGWIFADTILGFFAALGITGFKMWQIGAILGFVGSFFKSSVSTPTKK